MDHARSKVQFGAILALAVACLLLMPAQAWAASQVTVDGTKYDTQQTKETWSWDGDENMTLNGYTGGAISAVGSLAIDMTDSTITALGDNEAAIYVENGDLTVNVSGENTVRSSSEEMPAVMAEGSVTVEGDGTLNVTSESAGVVAYDGDLNLEGGSTVNVDSKGNGLVSYAGDVTIEDATANVKVQGAEMNGFGEESEMAIGIAAQEGSVVIRNATVDVDVDVENGAIAYGIFGYSSQAADKAQNLGNVGITNSKVNVNVLSSGTVPESYNSSQLSAVTAGIWAQSTPSDPSDNEFTGLVGIVGSEVSVVAQAANATTYGISTYAWGDNSANVLIANSTVDTSATGPNAYGVGAFGEGENSSNVYIQDSSITAVGKGTDFGVGIDLWGLGDTHPVLDIDRSTVELVGSSGAAFAYTAYLKSEYVEGSEGGTISIDNANIATAGVAVLGYLGSTQKRV